VVELGADLGLAFDGDSDRCGFIDNHGHHIAADRLLALLAKDLLSRQQGAKVVFDVKASQALPDYIRQYGGEPVMWKTGHSLMKLKMHEIGSPLGGEVSGHLFMGEEYYGFDDAPLVALRTLEIIARSGKSISELFEDIPKLVATPEIILSAPDNVKFAIIDEISAELAKHYEVFTLDGVRASFEDGWGLVRASNTQPAITLRFEAHTTAGVVANMQHFKALMDTHPEIDQTKFIEQIEKFKAMGTGASGH
jgi:phosphomannomutase/phosphoglucomutase